MQPNFFVFFVCFCFLLFVLFYSVSFFNAGEFKLQAVPPMLVLFA